MPATTHGTDAELLAFLERLPPAQAPAVRTLARAWQGGGGHLGIGRHAVRLIASDPQGRAFTAGTLHAAHGLPPGPALELARVLLQAHGVSAAAWTAWCDERPELRSLGFAADAKFPVVRLHAVPDTALARLALGLRDLALGVARPAEAAARQDQIA